MDGVEGETTQWVSTLSDGKLNAGMLYETKKKGGQSAMHIGLPFLETTPSC